MRRVSQRLERETERERERERERDNLYIRKLDLLKEFLHEILTYIPKIPMVLDSMTILQATIPNLKFYITLIDPNSNFPG